MPKREVITCALCGADIRKSPVYVRFPEWADTEGRLMRMVGDTIHGHCLGSLKKRVGADVVRVVDAQAVVVPEITHGKAEVTPIPEDEEPEAQEGQAIDPKLF